MWAGGVTNNTKDIKMQENDFSSDNCGKVTTITISWTTAQVS